MGYNAKIYKVFIASPDDVKKEREIVRSVLMRWNAINAESRRIVLFVGRLNIKYMMKVIKH